MSLNSWHCAGLQRVCLCLTWHIYLSVENRSARENSSLTLFWCYSLLCLGEDWWLGNSILKSVFFKREPFLQGIPSVIHLAYAILGIKSETHNFTFLCSLKMFLFQDHMFITLQHQAGQHYFEYFLDTHEILQITTHELQLHCIYLLNKNLL